MTCHLVDGKLGSNLTLREEVVDELNSLNEENGWKMCKRRSKLTKSEPKVEPKKKRGQNSHTTSGTGHTSPAAS